MSLKDRIIQAKKNGRFRNNVELAAEISRLMGREVSPQSIQALIGPSANFQKSKFIPYIAQACGVDDRWLATGEGDMARGSGDKQPHYGHLRRMAQDIVRSQKILLDMIDALNPGSPEYAKIIANIEKRKKTKAGKAKK